MSTRVTRSAKAKMVPKLAGASLKATIKSETLATPPAKPQSRRNGTVKNNPSKNKTAASSDVVSTTENASRKRKRAFIKREESPDDLPHNLGTIKPNQALKDNKEEDEQFSKKKLKIKSNKETTVKKSPSKKSRAEKNTNYGLTPGETPYPDWPHPTPEECAEVARLLTSVHGEAKPPETIPVPSLTVSGCGEVPSVLDALVRTRLSAATTAANSSRAFQGLVERFGIIESGVGKGSVNWNAVRQAPVSDIFTAIKCGGLADVKSKDIKNILQMVFEENQTRRATLASTGTEPQDSEAAKAGEDVISLDHLHQVSSDEAFDALVKYPGIGPKTASCVLLFCLQRPSFAVDTHVFRICKWLGWVPSDKATRNSTYAHCEVRIPDELKYPLHHLMVKHGRVCPRCRAATGEGSSGWEKGCVIEHLVNRSGGRKGYSDTSTAKNMSKKKRKSKTIKEEEDESDLSEVESDDLSDWED